MGINYDKTGDTITITVLDPTYKKTGSWKFNTADKELGEGILKHIMRKYGYNTEIKPSDSVGEKNKEIKKDKDWLDMSVDW